MKKLRLFLALALMLAVALVFVVCKNDADSTTKFEGRWLNLAAINYGYTDFSYTFTGNNFVFRYAGTENSSMSGTFTFTGTTITFSPTGGAPWTQPYTLDGNVLTLAQIPGHSFGPFTKQ